MVFRYLLFLLLYLSFSLPVPGQKDNFAVMKAPFSSAGADEFSPAWYKDGVVFCSNTRTGAFSGYATKNNKPFFKLYYADTSGNFTASRLVEGDVNSHFNNGPATFSPGGDTMYFSRNLVVSGNFKDVTAPENKLGLFYAVLKNGTWTNVTEMRFNDNSWNVTTPCLSPDGRTLFFASDKPDGFGGSDLYYSKWKNGYWSNPVNLGNIVNTEGNEAYPFVNEQGDLFFSSDGHKGKGGKDIFFTTFVDTSWIAPVDLNSPVNSSANDFGFITDNILSKGYFSSDRGKMLDIYSFKTIYPQFLYCYPSKENSFCLSFADDAVIDIDPLTMKFQWDMGNGAKPSGYTVRNCFPGAGKYIVTESIADKKTGRVFFNKLKLEVEVKEAVLPQINTGDKLLAGIPVKFAPALPKGFSAIGNYWDFGDSETGNSSEISHVYSQSGEYEVKLLTRLKNNESGKLKQVCVKKIISIPVQGQTASIAREGGEEDIHNPENSTSVKIFSASDEIARKAVYVVELMKSEKKLAVNDPVFRNISSKYIIRRVMLPGEKSWTYLSSEELDFMAAYPALTDAISSGFNNAMIRTYMPSDTGEIELWNFKRVYGTSSADYFMNNGLTLSQHGITLLDRMVLLLRRNPALRILIESHTDSSVPDGLQLTTRQAQGISDYLVNRGIERSRLIAKGYGNTRPVSPEYPESVRLKNRRIDFIAFDNQ